MPPPPDELGAAAEALAGAEVDTTHPGVVQVRHWDTVRERWLYCSGTLLSPRHVLTAAHCIYSNGRTEVCFFPSDGTRGGCHSVADCMAEPRYNPSASTPHACGEPPLGAGCRAHDIAVLFLDFNVAPAWSTAPDSVIHVTHHRLPGATDLLLDAGSEFIQVGYGGNDPSLPATRRFRSNTIMSFDFGVGRELFVPSLETLQPGDAGGPAFAVAPEPLPWRAEPPIGVACTMTTVASRGVYTSFEEAEHLRFVEEALDQDGDGRLDYGRIRESDGRPVGCVGYGFNRSANPDTDVDGDGHTNDEDALPTYYNPCGEGDRDGDGIRDELDNCPDDPRPDQTDTDGDGRGDICDNCPTFPNPDQSDRDFSGFDPADGIGDVCDNCPDHFNPDQADCDRNGAGDACDFPDADGDGLHDRCEDTCPGVADPPRPRTAGPEVGNCNYDAEVAAGVSPRGDLCDDIVCPDTEPVTLTIDRDVRTVYVGNNHFRVDALAVDPGIGEGRFSHRFCRCDRTYEDTFEARRACGATEGCVVAADLDAVRLHYDLPHDDDQARGWKPIETALGAFARAGTLTRLRDDPETPEDESRFIVGDTMYRARFAERLCEPPLGPRDPPVCFPHVAGADRVAYADDLRCSLGDLRCSEDTVTWMLSRDLPRFRASPYDPPPFASQMTGVLWSHVRSYFPGRCGPSGAGPCPPTVDRVLSSNFWSGEVTDATAWRPPVPVRPILPAAVPCPACRYAFPRMWLVDPCIRSLCAAPQIAARASGVSGGPADVDVTSSFSELALAALLDPSRKWMAPSDPVTAVPGARLVTSVSLDGSSAGPSLRLSYDGSLRLDTPQDGQQPPGDPIEPPGDPIEPPGDPIDPPGDPIEPPPSPNEPPPLYELAALAASGPAWGPDPRRLHGVAFFARHGLVYVAGGRRLSSGEPARDLWEHRLSTGEWSRIVLEGPERPLDVLATAIDADDGLLVLDEEGAARGAARARLLRIDLRTGAVQLLGSWPRRSAYTSFALAAAPDGAFYLVASHERAMQHLVVRLRAAGGTLEVTGIASGAGAVAGQALASEAGVSLLVSGRDGSVTPLGVRTSELLPARRPILPHTF